MTINKRRPELFALSDRNIQQRFGARRHRPKDKASLSLRQVLRVCVRGRRWGGRLRREVPSHSELFRSIKSSV